MLIERARKADELLDGDLLSDGFLISVSYEEMAVGITWTYRNNFLKSTVRIQDNGEIKELD